MATFNKSMLMGLLGSEPVHTQLTNQYQSHDMDSVMEEGLKLASYGGKGEELPPFTENAMLVSSILVAWDKKGTTTRMLGNETLTLKKWEIVKILVSFPIVKDGVNAVATARIDTSMHINGMWDQKVFYPLIEWGCQLNLVADFYPVKDEAGNWKTYESDTNPHKSGLTTYRVTAPNYILYVPPAKEENNPWRELERVTSHNHGVSVNSVFAAKKAEDKPKSTENESSEEDEALEEVGLFG
jgi:hypothetical protein